MEETLKQFKKTELIQLLISGISGIVICLMASAIGNAVLVEISINIVFSAYFGICFIIIGVLLLMRVNSLPENSQLQKNKKFLQYFGMMVLASGIICFCLERDWYQQIKLGINIWVIMQKYLYMLSSEFLLILHYYLDLLILQILQLASFSNPGNELQLKHQIKQQAPFLLAPQLVSYMDCYSVLWILKNFHTLENRLVFEEKICMPLVGLLGLFGGVANEYLRLKGDKFMPYTFETVKDPFTEEI